MQMTTIARTMATKEMAPVTPPAIAAVLDSREDGEKEGVGGGEVEDVVVDEDSDVVRLDEDVVRLVLVVTTTKSGLLEEHQRRDRSIK